MATFIGGGPTRKRRPAFKGVVMQDISNGAERVRAWPSKRGAATKAKTKQLNDDFREAQIAAKYWDARTIIMCDNLRKGTPVLIRDLQVMMMYNRFARIILPNGKVMLPVAARQDVSESLDAICPLPGAMLLRSVDGWRFIEPPETPGDLLTVNSEHVPEWITPAVTPGYHPWDINVPSAASFSLASGDATQLGLTDNGDVGLTVNVGTPVLGQISRIAYKTLTNKALAWTATLKISAVLPPTANSGVGLYLRDTVSNRSASLELAREDGTTGVFRWTGLAGFSSAPFTAIYKRPVNWAQVVSDGTTLSFNLSADGKLWFPIYSEAIGAWLTSKPNQIGFGSNTARTTGHRTLLGVHYFTLTGPGV